jgi:23S rRNA (cytidine1920-2'-O)/16S rRNA (cytidine1409-2'-O)-methyltransferase
MVKPQFEVGRGNVGAGGVVREPELRADAVLSVAAAARTLGLGLAGVVASELPGPSGNVEFFVWLRRGAPGADESTVRAVTAASPVPIPGDVAAGDMTAGDVTAGDVAEGDVAAGAAGTGGGR